MFMQTLGWLVAGVLLAVVMWLRRAPRTALEGRDPDAPERWKATHQVVRAAARAVLDARWAYENRESHAEEVKLLLAIEAAEGALITAGIETLMDGITFEQALAAARAGTVIVRRGQPEEYRWVRTNYGGVFERRTPRVTYGVDGEMVWLAWAPTDEEKAARDWVRQTLPSKPARRVVDSSVKDAGEMPAEMRLS